MLYVMHMILSSMQLQLLQILILYLSMPQHIKAQSSLLDQRWNGIRTIPNTLKIHYVKSLSSYNVEVRPFSKSNEKKTLLKTIKKNISFFNISHSKQAFFYFCLKNSLLSFSRFMVFFEKA